MVKLFSIHIDKIKTSLPELYHNVLNTVEQQHVNRQKVKEIRRQRILSRAILRLLLGQEINKHAKSIQIHTTQHGKPFLKNQSLYFNVSHTNQMLVIATSSQYEVGIDIEYQHSDFQAKHMPQQCFHSQEWEYFQPLSHNTKQKFFLKMWTTKEAISKALGLGFQLPFSQLNTLETKKPIIINSDYVQQYDIPSPRSNYIAALATMSPQTCQLSAWQELQDEWINKCLM